MSVKSVSVFSKDEEQAIVFKLFLIALKRTLVSTFQRFAVDIVEQNQIPSLIIDLTSTQYDPPTKCSNREGTHVDCRFEGSDSLLQKSRMLLHKLTKSSSGSLVESLNNRFLISNRRSNMSFEHTVFGQ